VPRLTIEDKKSGVSYILTKTNLTTYAEKDAKNLNVLLMEIIVQ
jgi:hypothetical protein